MHFYLQQTSLSVGLLLIDWHWHLQSLKNKVSCDANKKMNSHFYTQILTSRLDLIEHNIQPLKLIFLFWNTT